MRREARLVIWITGMSGSGKSTLADAVVGLAKQNRVSVVLVDGDAVREVWGDALGYEEEDRRRNMARMGRLCQWLDFQGQHVVAAVVAPFRDQREWNRQHIAAYYEVFIDTPVEQLIARDPKGLYEKALANKIGLPGINQTYEWPTNPDLVIDNVDSRDALCEYAGKLLSLFA